MKKLTILPDDYKLLTEEEKKEFVKFIKSQFGESITYHDGYPLYFDEEGKMLQYDLEEGYEIYKQLQKI